MKIYSVITLVVYILTCVLPVHTAFAESTTRHGGNCNSATPIPAFGGSVRNHSLSTRVDFVNDYDFFSIKIKEPGRLDLYSTGNSVDTIGFLFSSSCFVLLTDLDSGAGRNFHISWNVTPGKYYLATRQYCIYCPPPADPNYDLHFKFTPENGSGLEAVSQLLLGGAFPTPFVGDGPSDNGGLVKTSAAKAKTGTSSSGSTGFVSLSNPELSTDIKLKLQDDKGNPISGLNVQWRALNGNLDLYVWDPQGRYAPTVYQGNPLLDAYKGTNPNITIDDTRAVGIVTLAVIGLSSAFILYTAHDYSLTMTEIDYFHTSNLAATYENVGVFQCTIGELLKYLRDNYHGKVCGMNLIFSVAGLGISSPMIGAAFTIGNEVTWSVWDEGFSKASEKNYKKSLKEMFGEEVTEDTQVFVRIKDFQEAGMVGNDLAVAVYPLNYDDKYEENDTLVQSSDLELKNLQGLVVKKSDPDYFSFNLNQDDSWTGSIAFLGDKGDLKLKLYDPQGDLLDSSSGRGDSQTVGLTKAPSYGEYTLAVENSGGSWNSMMYSLNATSTSGQAIGSDTSFRVVLNWGNSPTDLDSHLWTPSIDGQVSHVYYGNKLSATKHPFVGLDVDDRNGYGPETITINELFAGTYNFSVYNYSGGNIAGSGATVKIYNNSSLLRTLTVPASGSGRWWDVFEINGNSGALNFKNQIRTSSPRLIEKMPPK